MDEKNYYYKEAKGHVIDILQYFVTLASALEILAWFAQIVEAMVENHDNTWNKLMCTMHPNPPNVICPFFPLYTFNLSFHYILLNFQQDIASILIVFLFPNKLRK